MLGRFSLRPDAQRSRGVLASIVGLLCVVWGPIGCGESSPVESAAPAEAPTRRPNVLMVVIDTLRADRLGAYGNARGLTPFLDQLASSATVFSNAYSTSSWTCPAIASLFTSRHPSQHRTTRPDARLVESEVTLAEVLAPLGYATAGFVANLRLDRDLGFGQGFERWRVFKQIPLVRGDVVREHAMRWLDEQLTRAPEQPIFLYIHLMEPHSPYHPPADLRERFSIPDSDLANSAEAHEKLETPRFPELSDAEVELLASLYDAEVAAADQALYRLFRQLRKRGFLRDALTVITSDHGEEFREHDMLGHGNTLYESAIRVPLMFVSHRGGVARRIDELVSLIDVAPTIVELLGAEAPASFEGRSLAGWLRPGAEPAVSAGPGVLTELYQVSPGIYDYRRHQRAFIRGDDKLIVSLDGSSAYVDLRRDPAEQRPVPSDTSDTGSDLATDVARLRADLFTRRNATVERGPIDEETREKLRTLGYAF